MLTSSCCSYCEDSLPYCTTTGSMFMYQRIAQSARFFWSSFISGIAYWSFYWCLLPNTSAHSALQYNELTGKTFFNEWSISLQMCASRVLLVIDAKNKKGPRNWQATMSAASNFTKESVWAVDAVDYLPQAYAQMWSICPDLNILIWKEAGQRSHTKWLFCEWHVRLLIQDICPWLACLVSLRHSASHTSYSRHVLTRAADHVHTDCTDKSSRSCTHRLYWHDNRISGICRAPCQTPPRSSDIVWRKCTHMNKESNLGAILNAQSALELLRYADLHKQHFIT